MACVLGAPASFGDSSSITAQAPFQIVATGFEQPTGLVVHPAGDLFLTDRETGVLYRLTPGFTSSGKADFATSVVFAGLDEPMGVTVEHNGGLLVAESDKGRLVRCEAPDLNEPALYGLYTKWWNAKYARPRWNAKRVLSKSAACACEGDCTAGAAPSSRSNR